jgi:signal transduction histidine kinase
MNDFLKQFFRTQIGRNFPEPLSAARTDNAQVKADESQFNTHARIESSEARQLARQNLAEELSLALNIHARQYIKTLSEALPNLNLHASEPVRVPEPQNWIPRKEQKAESQKKQPFYNRWKVTGATHTLSVRASPGLIEFFVVPDKEVPHISMSEFGSRFRTRFKLHESDSGMVWKCGNERLDAEQSCRFIEHFLDELAAGKEKFKAKPFPDTIVPNLEKQLEMEKNNLLFKLLNQQEELKNQLARDLHDSVIADLMMLKRYLAGDKQLSPEETIEIIDEVVLQLRDIVNEYSPRQLQEWGLQVGIEDLLDRLARRTGLKCNLNFSGELPKYPDLVCLHIFRVVQESLNNIEKHAGASEVSVTIQASQYGQNVFEICDNGTGFDSGHVRLEADGSHSMGLEGMRERMELIRCFYPCQLSIESSKSSGTRIILTISPPA